MAPNTLDFTKIEFPSDQITVGVIRRIHPTLLIEDSYRESENRDFHNMLETERRVSQRAFDEATTNDISNRGSSQKADPRSDHQWEKDVDRLQQYYARFGVSDGRASTIMLMQNIVKKSKAQATNAEKPISQRC